MRQFSHSLIWSVTFKAPITRGSCELDITEEKRKTNRELFVILHTLFGQGIPTSGSGHVVNLFGGFLAQNSAAKRMSKSTTTAFLGAIVILGYISECSALQELGTGSINVQKSNFVDDSVDDGFPMPRFMAEVNNQTVTAGREAKLTCKVKDLGNYKVAWVRVDTQTILTIHHNIITRNQRISLSHHDHKVWRLHINNVQESDRGWYMCQVNTDPMRSERAFLEVVVPPSIIDARTSADNTVKEGSPVNLTCDARGSPRPKIMWKREDGELIRYNGGLMSTVDGNSLIFNSASRAHAGEYLCIASNGVPPSISKRIVLRVQFAPMIWVQNQLEFAILGHNVSLQCNTESFPPAIHFWKRQNGSAISPGGKYKVHKEVKKFVTQVTLTIFDVNPHDFGSYYCVAKNPLGESDGSIKLSARPSTTTAHPNPETSFGQFNANSGEKQMKQKGSHVLQRNGDLSYNPFPPTTKVPENTWDADKSQYPLFGSGISTREKGSNKWMCIAIVLITVILSHY